MESPLAEAATKGRRAFRQSDDSPVEIVPKAHVMTGESVSSHPAATLSSHVAPAAAATEHHDESRSLVLRIVDRALYLLERTDGGELGSWDRLILNLTEQIAAQTVSAIQARVQPGKKPRGGKTAAGRANKLNIRSQS